jgi:hypothetical protein
MRGIERRLARLERVILPVPRADPPVCVFAQPDETVEGAIFRSFGEPGLPPRRPDDPPHIVFRLCRPIPS